MRYFWPIYSWIILSASCSAGNRRHDPNYSEEYNQVYDAKLKAISVISCGLQNDLKAYSRLPHSILVVDRALKRLNFEEHEILVCPDMQSTFQNRTGLKSRVLSPNQLSISNVDVLFMVDSSASRSEVTYRKTGDGYGSKKLSIHVDLNNQQDLHPSDQPSMYDGVLLSSHSEVRAYTLLYGMTSGWEKAPFPTPVVINAASVGIQKQISEYLTSKLHNATVEISDTRNNSISILLPDILSHGFSVEKDLKWILRAIGKLCIGPDRKIIGHVYILFATSIESLEQRVNGLHNENIKIETMLKLMNDYVLTFFEQRHITYSFVRYCQENCPPSSGSRSDNSVTRSTVLIRALLQSSVAWIRLPLSLTSLPTSNMAASNSLSESTADKEHKSNLIMLAVTEEFIGRAALHGCVSFVLVDFTLKNDTVTYLTESIPVSIDIKESYQWLTDDVSSFLVLSAKDLASATANKVFSHSPQNQHKMRLKAVGDDALSRLKEEEATVGGMVLEGVLRSVFKRFTKNTENIAALRNMTHGFSASLPSASYAAVRYQPSVLHVTKSTSDILRNDVHTTFAAIIVEPRFDPNFEFCVRNVMYHLGDRWSLLVFHSTGPFGNEKYVRHALRNMAGVEFVPLDDSVHDGSSYNQVLVNVEFWRNLQNMKLSKVFIFQTDSVLLRRGMEEFMHWDYIGAPWNMQHGADSGHWLRQIQRGGGLVQGVGNGGTSLRSVSAMLEIATLYKSKSGRFNEDTFFAFFCEKLGNIAKHKGSQPSDNQKGCLLADRKAAYAFAVEMPIAVKDINMAISDVASGSNSSNTSSPVLFVPLALHSTWVYADTALSSKLLQLAMRPK